MSERENVSGATWKAVRTLEYKKKQKAPHSEPKGFGAILDEAHDAVTDKLTASGNTVSSYLNRLSEIQIQDEAYIHQQLVKPDEAKAKRGLQSFLSKAKGRGIRLPRSGSSRKVRFNEDSHSKAARSGAIRADAASGGGAEQLAQLYKVSSPTTPKRAASFSTSTKSPGSRRAGLCGFKDMDRLEGTTAAAEPELMPPVVLAATGKAIARRSGTSSGNNSSASAVSAVVDGHAALGPGSQGTAKDQLAQLTIGPAAAPASIATSGDGGIMARFLNQNFDGPPDPAAHNAASAGRHWDGPSKTQLADQQLQMLRTSTALAPASAEGPGVSEQPDGFRPLAIPEDIFARWSSAAGGSNNSSNSKCASGGSSSPPKPNADGDATSQHQASRRVSSSGILKTSAADQQVLTGGGASTSSLMRSMRSTADYTTSSHAGATDRSQPRRSADYPGAVAGHRRSSCDGQSSRLGSDRSTHSSGQATPERRVSSPHFNNSTTAQHSNSPGSLAGPGGLRGRSNRLLELSTAGTATEAHHCMSPNGCGAASLLANGSIIADSNKTSRMSSADSGSGPSSAAASHTRPLHTSSHSPVSSSSVSGMGGAAGLRKSSDKGLHLPTIGRATAN